MSHSSPFRTSTRPVSDEAGESIESIPWESLDTLGQPRDHRRLYAIAGAIVVIAIGVSAVRNLAGSSPVPVADTVATSVTSAPPVEPTSPTTVPDAALVTEADLMAIEPHMLERSAAAFAETAAAEYFTGFAEGIWTGVDFDRTRTTFVEYATAVEVNPLGPFEFDVLVAVSVLDAGPDEPFVRRPVRGISIVVDASAGDLRPVTLPSPAVLPFRQLEPSSVDPVSPSDEQLGAITRAVQEFGEVRSVEYREHPTGGGSATVVVVDAVGIGWPMNVEVDSDGTVQLIG